MYNYKLTRLSKTDNSGYHRSDGIPVPCQPVSEVTIGEMFTVYAESLSNPGEHYSRLIRTSPVVKINTNMNSSGKIDSIIFETESGSSYKLEKTITPPLDNLTV